MQQQTVGIGAAVLSSMFGGMAVAFTRLLGGSVAPELLGMLRFGIAGLLLLPVALLLVRRRLAPRDLLFCALLGMMGFGIFPVIYNSSISLTSASRASLALCTMPVFTMLLAAALRLEVLSLKRTVGVVIAILGVALALLGSLSHAPEGAWRGDLLMLGGTSLMAVFNVLSRGLIGRLGVLAFTTVTMLSGAALSLAVNAAQDNFTAFAGFTELTWWVVAYLGVGGGVAAFLLWSVALKTAPVTIVALSVTVSPLSAALVATLMLDEPISLPLIAGLCVVGVGIWLTAVRPRTPAA